MTDDQPQLFASPTWYDNLQQPPQVPEELAVQLHPLPRRSFTLTRSGPRALSHLYLKQSSCLLLRDGITYSVDQGKKESKVDSSRDFGPVLEVKVRERGEKLLDGSIRGGERQRQDELRVSCHAAMEINQRKSAAS